MKKKKTRNKKIKKKKILFSNILFLIISYIFFIIWKNLQEFIKIYTNIKFYSIPVKVILVYY